MSSCFYLKGAECFEKTQRCVAKNSFALKIGAGKETNRLG